MTKWRRPREEIGRLATCPAAIRSRPRGTSRRYAGGRPPQRPRCVFSGCGISPGSTRVSRVESGVPPGSPTRGNSVLGADRAFFVAPVAPTPVTSLKRPRSKDAGKAPAGRRSRPARRGCYPGGRGMVGRGGENPRPRRSEGPKEIRIPNPEIRKKARAFSWRALSVCRFAAGGGVYSRSTFRSWMDQKRPGARPVWTILR